MLDIVADESSASLRAAIGQMRAGDIKSFMIARRIMDEMDFIELSKTIDEQSLSGLFLARCFLEQVISNLAADSMFEFPPAGTELHGIFQELASHTGAFLESLLSATLPDDYSSLKSLSRAVGIYYRYLGILNNIGQVSDLGDHESIWQEQQGGASDEHTPGL